MVLGVAERSVAQPVHADAREGWPHREVAGPDGEGDVVTCPDRLAVLDHGRRASGDVERDVAPLSGIADGALKARGCLEAFTGKSQQRADSCVLDSLHGVGHKHVQSIKISERRSRAQGTTAPP